MNKQIANTLTGGLTMTTKMPCNSYSLPAIKCKVGSALRKVEGSTCSGCYAMKWRYVFPNVKDKMDIRYDSIYKKGWVDGMVYLINSTKNPYFRWHDSGDIDSVRHLGNICDVVRRTPAVKHWLPTREVFMVAEYIKSGKKIPDNLTIRVSNTMVDGIVNPMAKIYGLVTSGVSVNNYNCPASKQDNKCKSCRLCWDKGVKHIDYKKH